MQLCKCLFLSIKGERNRKRKRGYTPVFDSWWMQKLRNPLEIVGIGVFWFFKNVVFFILFRLILKFFSLFFRIWIRCLFWIRMHYEEHLWFLFLYSNSGIQYPLGDKRSYLWECGESVLQSIHSRLSFRLSSVLEVKGSK